MGVLLSSQRSSSMSSSSSIDALSDEEIYELIRKRSNSDKFPAPTSFHAMFPSKTWRISKDAVLKLTHSPTEVFMMSYVSQHTTIPIPKVRRVLPAPGQFKGRSRWILMDYIDGLPLYIAWNTMSWWRRLCTMWTVCRYIRELQTVPIPNNDVPGPFDDTGRAYPCVGYYFTEDGAGPFSSYGAMARWFDRRRFDTLAGIHEYTGKLFQIPKFDASYPLRLCHMDLHTMNIIVDRSGKVWIIDWERAGAYPPWLEYCQMASWDDAINDIARPPKVYSRFMRFMTGGYWRFKSEYLDKLEWAWTRPLEDYYPLDYFTKQGMEVD